MKNRIINVQDVPISISEQKLDDYICITDIAKAKTGESRSADVVKNWLRNRNTLELSIPIKTSTFFGNSEHSFPEKQSIPFRNRVQFIF